MSEVLHSTDFLPCVSSPKPVSPSPLPSLPWPSPTSTRSLPKKSKNALLAGSFLNRALTSVLFPNNVSVPTCTVNPAATRSSGVAVRHWDKLTYVPDIHSENVSGAPFKQSNDPPAPNPKSIVSPSSFAKLRRPFSNPSPTRNVDTRLPLMSVKRFAIFWRTDGSTTFIAASALQALSRRSTKTRQTRLFGTSSPASGIMTAATSCASRATNPTFPGTIPRALSLGVFMTCAKEDLGRCQHSALICLFNSKCHW